MTRMSTMMSRKWIQLPPKGGELGSAGPPRRNRPLPK